MGNSISYPTNNMKGGYEKLNDELDYIATYYILTMDFQSLRKLYDKQYCNELVVLTSDIMNRYFSDMNISHLSDRIKYGSEKVLFMRKENIENLNAIDPKEKNNICNYIAKFYIKIAHIFAAVLMTINPEYIFSDSTGKKIRRKLSEKSTIPNDTIIEKVNTNLCDSRIHALKGEGNIDLEDSPHKDKEINVKPKICSIDIYTNPEGSNKSELLTDIPGISELMDLYYDTDYDLETGSFKGMTEKTTQQFNADLKQFYQVFTGSEIMPEDIKKFSDIKLKDYSQSKLCQDNQFDKEYSGDYKNKLFIDYANNLKKMLLSVNEKKQILLEALNTLFVYVKDPTDPDKEVIRVNPQLTEDTLQELIEKTRESIVELYLNCEIDFLEGVKLYEAIIEAQILETAQKQIDTLQTEAVKLYKS